MTALRPATHRREAYAADITYGTNNEFGFDYLRDNMVYSKEDMVQRDLHYAIVDEVDNILVDEARTPLIISGPAEAAADDYERFARVVTRMREEHDFTIEQRSRSIQMTEEGIDKVEKLLGVQNLYAAREHGAEPLPRERDEGAVPVRARRPVRRATTARSSSSTSSPVG